MFDVFKNSIAKVKKESILSVAFILCETFFEIIVPFMMAKLIDLGIEKSDLDNIYRFGFIILGLVFGQALSGILCAVFATRAGSGFAKDLRERLFRKLQTFSFANIDKFSTGSLVTRSTTDISNVQRAFQTVIRGAVRSISMCICSLYFAYTINKEIATYFALLIPVMIISFLLVSKLAMPIFEKMFYAFDSLNNIMSENIHGIRVVKTFNREEYEYNKMKKSADDIYDYAVKAESYVAIWDPFMNIMVYTVVIIISWLGAKAIIASGNNPDLGLTTGKLMSLLTYGLQMLMSLLFMSMIYVMLVLSSASIKRVMEVIKEESSIKNPIKPIYKFDDASIEFKNVSFKYREDSKFQILKDINIKINSGEMIGIIGGTGSGKSSLVNLIPRLYDVNSGEVIVGNHKVKEYDLNTLRSNIGIVLQKSILFSGTIASNLRFGNEEATLDDMKDACEISEALEFINQKPEGFDSVVEQSGNNFSGGQKQRISIARTILKKPKILIFDDSTSAVDTKTDAKIRDALKNKLPNTTKIIISQRIISIKDCDKILVIDNGKVVAYDTHDNLLNLCPLYKEIYEVQNN